MSSYSLFCEISPDLKEIVIANGYSFGMSGSLEEASEKGFKITCYYKDVDTLQAALKDLQESLPELMVSTAEIQDEDWNAKWKESMKPATIAPGVFASPVWLPPEISPDEHWIRIEPKMAFGTGHHATTRLAARGIRRTSNSLPSRYALLDIGCGSGVLCFMAELFGAGFTAGIDIDPVCAENLAENRSNNKQTARGGFFVGNLDIFKYSPIFDCVVMNMIRTESEPCLDQILKLLKPAGRLIWSGILVEEKKLVIENAIRKGFRLREETTEEEWWCGEFGIA
ncbi:MAG TPA: hypothetical protein DCO75_11565 [Fibrobacteres bacterium]|jgi:ribosomal protein L11 methyltransferase|nr:hypothetical protein [Fibrobacterota bacterium]